MNSKIPYPLPIEACEQVERYLEDQFSAVEKCGYRSLLDQTGVAELYDLIEEVHASAFHDGRIVQTTRMKGQELRRRYEDKKEDEVSPNPNLEQYENLMKNVPAVIGALLESTRPDFETIEIHLDSGSIKWPTAHATNWIRSLISMCEYLIHEAKERP